MSRYLSTANTRNRRAGRFLRPALALALLASGHSAGAGCPPPTVPFTAEYELYRNGDTVGTTTISLERREDGSFDYRLESEAEHGFIGFVGARFFEHSHWVPHEGRPRPLNFERGQSIAFHDRYYEAHFDWTSGTARGKARGEPWQAGELPVGTQDRLLVNLTLLADLRCDADELSYRVMEKGELDTWRFDRQGRETVEVPGGTYDTIRVGKEHSSPDRRSLSWHAPALNWLAVRIEHQDGEDEDLFAMELKRYSPLP